MLNPTVVREFEAAAAEVGSEYEATQLARFAKFIVDLAGEHRSYRDYRSSIEDAMSEWIEFVRREVVTEDDPVIAQGAATAARAMLSQMVDQVAADVEQVNEMNQRGEFSGGGLLGWLFGGR